MLRALIDVMGPYHEFAAKYFKHAAEPTNPLIMWNVIASQAPGGRGSDDGADGPAGPPRLLRVTRYEHVGATYFEHGQDRNLLFGRDSFVKWCLSGSDPPGQPTRTAAVTEGERPAWATA
jgi:hypothetical protein